MIMKIGQRYRCLNPDSCCEIEVTRASTEAKATAHASRLGKRKIGWHTFRRSFATLLTGSNENTKTTQELMRHANAGITMNLYAQALTPAKRAAHLKVVEMIRPAAGTASCSFVFPRSGSRVCNCLIIWSGLSESNRHLNLGKVPYYHYTKAAQFQLFITCLRGN